MPKELPLIKESDEVLKKHLPVDSIKERYSTTHLWLKVTVIRVETYLYNLDPGEISFR